MPRCVGSKPDGTPCERIVGASQSYCYSHDPERQEDRKRSASKGGRSGGRGRPLSEAPGASELADIKGRLRALIEDVRTGAIERSDAAVCAQLYNTLLRAVEAEHKRESSGYISPEQLAVTMSLVVDVLRRHVTDRHAFAAISRDFEELTQGSRAVK